MNRKRTLALLGAAGLALIAASAGLSILSPLFEYTRPILQRPTGALVSILMMAGALYLALIPLFRRAPSGLAPMAWMVGVGLAMRALYIPSTVILEDDIYRYLWDGAVVAHGFNPYAFAPGEFRAAQAGSGQKPSELRRLAHESGMIIERVNHAEIRTIYPPLAQGIFALAHWLKPWSVVAWRAVLLGFDLAALGLLFAALRALKQPAWMAAIYWWNPLLAKEIVNSGHMDVALFPFVLGAVWLAIHRRAIASAAMTALAAGVKVWPLALAPLALRPLLREPKRLALAAAVCLAIVAALFGPMCAAGLDPHSGLGSYSKSWQNNDALFRGLVWINGAVLEAIGSHAWHSQLVTRVMVCFLMGLCVALLARRPIRDGRDWCARALWIVAAVFLLSPTQFPWYYTWLVPFLALSPRYSLLAYTALLPLYYTRCILEPRGLLPWFENGVVWLEHAPVWLLLIGEWVGERRRGKGSPAEEPPGLAPTP